MAVPTRARVTLACSLAVIICFAACFSLGVHATLSTSECEKLGFTGLQACSDCERLAEYVKDTELVDDCKRCCVKDEGDTRKYIKARLEVCPYRLSGLPHISDFIDRHASAYKPALKIVRVAGVYPKITLTASGGERTTVRIDNWKVSTIKDYLNDKLQPAAAAT